MATTDPFFYGRDLINQQAQARALGQSKGFTPDELSGIIRGNFQAQQANEVTQRTLALNERNQAMKENELALNAKQAKKNAIGQTAMGGTSLAIQSYNAGMWGNKGQVKVGSSVPVDGSSVSASGVPALGGMETTAEVGGLGANTAIGETGFATNTAQGVVTTGSEVSTGTASIGGELATGAGWGGVGYMVGSNVVHGKYSKAAGIAAATLAGASAGGPYGAAAGFVVGALSAIFG